jgi:hypothetical protein
MSSKRLEISDIRQAPETRMVGPGRNPFNHFAGNPTSVRVLSRPNEPPPRKKVKTEHPHPHTASGGPYTQHGDRNNTRK